MSGPAPATVLRVGQVVAGRYKIIRQIARGGMSEVYEVEDTLVRERVALKILRRKTAQDPDAAERFRREILLARRITHPNVCRIFEAGLHEALPFLTMELLEGENLLQLVTRVGRITTADAMPIVEQVCDGLTAAHRAGVVHRDLKSSNIILVPQSVGTRGLRAVITDFGVARALQPDMESSVLTGTGVLVGTPAYMAPEQVEGKAVTEATDVYALGIVLYEMTTGQLPFTGANPLLTAELRLKKAPVPPRALVPEIDSRWERAILRCLLVRPIDRFHSASEILGALKEWAAVPTGESSDDDATTIDEASMDSDSDLHGPTVPMTAEQLALIEAAVAEVQAKRQSGSVKRPSAQLAATVPAARVPLAPITVPEPPRPPPPREPPPPPSPSMLPTSPLPRLDELPKAREPRPVREERPVRFTNPSDEPVQFVEASAAQVLEASGQRRLEYGFPRTRPEDLDLAQQRRLVLIIAIVALGVLVFWIAVDPFPSSFTSFYGPP